MRWSITTELPYKSFDYFERTLITNNGYREYDVRWLLGKEINPNGFVVLGRAYGTFVRETLREQSVVVGHDFREYSQGLCHSFILGLLSTGVDVVDVGLALTPMVYFAQHHFGTRGAAIITASHNENGWTGLKLADGISSTLGPDGIQNFKSIVDVGRFVDAPGKYRSYDELFQPYKEDIVSRGRLGRPLRVVVATGNGTAGRFAPSVLRELGCEVIELDCDADWDFPKHNPNPENIKFLESISKATVEHRAAIGIGIDGDGDRMGVVDDRGREVFSDKLGLLLARWFSKANPGRTIVIDVKSTGLFYDDSTLSRSGTKVVMWKTGHSYIKAKVRELNALAGFEKSGHWFFNLPFGRGYDDAILSAAHVLNMLDEMASPLSALVDSLPKTWQSPTLGAFCPDTLKYQVVEDVAEQYRRDRDRGVVIGGARIADLIRINGIRFLLEDKSWGLIRASSNKPSLVIVAESPNSERQLYEIIEDIRARLARTGKVGEYDQEMPRPAT